MQTLAAEFGTGEVFLSMLWFFLFFIWIWILIVVVIPYLGVLVYLIARGGKMNDHAVEAAQAQDAAMRQYVQSAAGTAASPADEVARLADLKSQGVIDDAEFQRLKAKAISGS